MATEFFFWSLKLKDSCTEMALPLLTFYKLYIDIDLFILYICSQYAFIYTFRYHPVRGGQRVQKKHGVSIKW